MSAPASSPSDMLEELSFWSSDPPKPPAEFLPRLLRKLLEDSGNPFGPDAELRHCLERKRKRREALERRVDAVLLSASSPGAAAAASAPRPTHLKTPAATATAKPPIRQPARGPTLPQRPRAENDDEDDDDEDATFELAAPGQVRKHEGQMTYEEFMATRKRAPRRGELGVTPEMVASYESQGYVMSGSQNKYSQKFIDRMQRQLHQKQAERLRLDLAEEEHRRREAEALSNFAKMAASGKKE